MATIRCTDVAGSAQFVAELRNRGGSSFVASLLELLRKARPPFWAKQRWRSPELRMQLLLQNDQYVFAAHPGMTRSFFFVPLKKEWSATNEGKRWGCGCSVDECGGSIVDWIRRVDDSLCSLSLHGSDLEGRSSKVLVAGASSAPVGSSATIQTVSADETDVEVVMSVSGAMRALVLFCNAVGVKPSPFVTEDFVGKASVTTTLTTVARPLTLCWDRSEKRHFESALAFKAPAFVHAWSAKTKQTVNSLMSEVGTKHGYFSDGRWLVHSLWWRQWNCLLGT